MKRTWVLVVGVLTCLAVTTASDRKRDQLALQPLIDEVMLNNSRARLRADLAYEQKVLPAIQRAQKVRAKGIQRVGKKALVRLNRLARDARNRGSDVGLALVLQAKEEISKSMVQPQSAAGILSITAGFQGHRYLAVVRRMSWKKAKAACQEMGGHLVCIETAEEMAFARTLAAGVRLWVGATDEHKEDDWRWLNGQLVNPSFWEHGKPDNWNKRRL